MKKRNYSQAGFTLNELLITIGIIGIIAGLILTAIARAKHKANRITCLNNLSQIGKALIGFGHDHEDRMPWQLEEGGRKLHFGEHYDENSSAIFGIYALKLEIQNARILHSPCDSGRATYSEEAQSHWAEYDTKEGKFIPPEAITYDLVKGGDTMRPTTILGLTRNLYSRELHKSRWVGADEKKVLSAERRDPPLPEGMEPRMMRHGPGWDGPHPWLKYIQKNIKKFPYGGARSGDLLVKFGEKKHLSQVVNGLNEGEGHVLMADGSTGKSNNDDLGPNGALVKPHLEAHRVGTHFHAMERGLASSVPRRRHIFLKDGTTAPRATAIAMRQEDPMVREWEYAGFKILGDEEFYNYVVSELELLKNEVPEVYKVAKIHVTTFNCTGINGTYAIICAPGNNWVNISRGVYNRNPDEVDAPGYEDAPVHTMIFMHEIQHCDWDSCGAETAANFAPAFYGKQMEIHPGWINFFLGMTGGYDQDMWDYHHSAEFAKNRTSYEDYVKKNGGGFNGGGKSTTK